MLFLDPEWGGPSYDEGNKLIRLTIGTSTEKREVEQFVVDVFKFNENYPKFSDH